MSEARVDLAELATVPREELGGLILLDYARYLHECNDDETLALELKHQATQLEEEAYKALRQRQIERGFPAFDFPGGEDPSFMNPALRAAGIRGLANYIDYRNEPDEIPSFKSGINLVGKLAIITAFPDRYAAISSGKTFRNKVHGTIHSVDFSASGNSIIRVDTGKRLKRQWSAQFLVDNEDYQANVSMVLHDS